MTEENEKIIVRGIEVPAGEFTLLSSRGRLREGYTFGKIQPSNGIRRGGGLHNCVTLSDARYLVFEDYMGIEVPSFKTRQNPALFDELFIIDAVFGINDITKYLGRESFEGKYSWHIDMIRKIAEAQGERK